MQLGKVLEYDGQHVFYQVIGSGKPVVLIHGFAEDSQVWKHQVETLKNKFQLIVPDLPGCGKSAGSNLQYENWSMEYFADLILALMRNEFLETSAIIGHSMGGYITLAFADKYTDHLRSFGLFHSSAYPDSEEKIATRRKGIEFIKKNGSADFLRQSIPNLFSPETREKNASMVNEMIEEYRDFDPQTLIACYEAMIRRPDRTHILQNFPKPILFIMGEHDNAVPFTDSLQQCHLPAVSYTHILHRSAHMGMLEETLKANQILEVFLQENA